MTRDVSFAKKSVKKNQGCQEKECVRGYAKQKTFLLLPRNPLLFFLSHITYKQQHIFFSFSHVVLLLFLPFPVEDLMSDVFSFTNTFSLHVHLLFSFFFWEPFLSDNFFSRGSN